MAVVVTNDGINNIIKIPDDVFTNSTGHIFIKGDYNTISIGDYTILNNTYIEFVGNNSNINIGTNCIFHGNNEFRCCTNNTNIIIGSFTTMLGVKIFLHEKGTITIGNDCMFSGGIMMDVSDMHSIIDAKSNKRINFAKDIKIEDHVWVGFDVFIAKGISIEKNAIIGAKSVVTKNVPKNTLVAGVPARIIKKDITWHRELIT